MALFDLLRKKNQLNPLRGMMNLGCFSVSGTNPETNRKKKSTVLANTEDEAAQKSGLVDCIVVEVGWGTPSSVQIDFLKKHGAKLPDGATAKDATALIERISKNENSAVPPSLVIEAAKNGIAMSFLTGRRQYERKIQGNGNESSDEK